MASSLFLASLLLVSFGAAASAGELCTPAQLKKCDFVVKGSAGAVPTVKLQAVNGNRVLSSAPIVHKSGEAVVSAYSSFCTFQNEKKPSGRCGNYFFFMSRNTTEWTKANLIASRMLPKELVAGFRNKCVMMRIDSMELKKSKWLNNGDGKKGFPQAQRCVMFNTA